MPKKRFNAKTRLCATHVEVKRRSTSCDELARLILSSQAKTNSDGVTAPRYAICMSHFTASGKPVSTAQSKSYI